MPRAIGAFRKVGFTVEAYPVDYQTTGPRELWTTATILMRGIPKADAAVPEWIGSHLFPRRCPLCIAERSRGEST